MALEIERRFLVEGDDWKTIAGNPQYLRQGYLATSIRGWTVRMRILEKAKAWLTLKAPAEGISKYEFEYSIPLDDAESLWEKAPYKITKNRYELNCHGNDWVIDCFKGRNYPLVIAEVELTSSEQPIEKPTWCYQEITSNQQLSNAALARTPITSWSKKDRQNMQIQLHDKENPSLLG